MPLSRRARRWLIALAILAALAGIGAIVVGRLLQPERLTPLILRRAGAAVGLELATAAPADYALRPGPRLVLPGFTATVPGEPAPLLRARRVELALPWSTLRGGDGPLTVTRIRLVAPELDVDALSRWLAARPETPDAALELPVLTDGLRVEGGRILASGRALEALHLDLPELAPGAPARLQASAVADFGGDRLHPISIVLQATPSTAAGDLLLDALQLDLETSASLPSLRADGSLRWGEAIALALRGQIEAWPAEWPALPPLAEDAPADASPALAFALEYEGDAALAAPLRLHLARGAAEAELEATPAAVADWLDAGRTSPLPPLRGRAAVPAIGIGGVRASGVVIELQDAAPAATDGD